MSGESYIKLRMLRRAELLTDQTDPFHYEPGPAWDAEARALAEDVLTYFADPGPDTSTRWT